MGTRTGSSSVRWLVNTRNMYRPISRLVAIVKRIVNTDGDILRAHRQPQNFSGRSIAYTRYTKAADAQVTTRASSHDVTYTRSQRAMKPTIAANVGQPENHHSNQSASRLHALPGALTCCRTTTPAPTSTVFWCLAQIVGAAAGEETLVRPVATELAAGEEPVGELVLGGQRDLVQHLIDAAKQPFVVEPLVAHATAQRGSCA